MHMLSVIQFNITVCTYIYTYNIFTLIYGKNQKLQNQSTKHKFYVDLDPKRYLGDPRVPIIGSLGYGEGGGIN